MDTGAKYPGRKYPSQNDSCVQNKRAGAATRAMTTSQANPVGLRRAGSGPAARPRGGRAGGPGPAG